jgi:flagellar protein FlaI
MKLARKFFKKVVQGWKNVSNKELKEVSPSISQKNENEINQVKVVPIISPVSVPMQVPLVVEKTVIEKKYEEEEKTEIEGIVIPRQLKVVPPPPIPQQPGEIFISYPLIPKNPKKGEKVFAYVKIYWDKRRQSYFYEVVEPKLDERMKEIVKRIKELLEQRLDVDLSKLNLTKAKEYLKTHIDEIVKYFKFRLTEEEVETVRYYVERDFLGLGKIDAIMKDPNIEDISCDGVNIPVFVFHRDPRLGSIPTNIVFEDSDELDSFIIKLAQLAGKSISINEPLVNGTLPDGSRLQATLATDIARRGSNFTIRKFMEEPLTPVHLIKYGTADERVLAYIWLAVDYGRSILIAGGTASGKTTMLNVLSLFIRPDKKIISIEDTAEIVLPHPHWISHVARTPISTGKEGEVDLFQLLKESLRQRPDYIVLGEVRGQEAYVLFQQMATGHPSFATIHAENFEKLIDRLTSPPISLPEGLIGSLDIVIFMQRVRYKERFVRRVTEIAEIVGVKKGKLPIVNYVFRWDPFKDSFEIGEKSVSLKKISQLTGLSEKDIINEFQRRVAILRWMKEKDITNFREVYTIISAYYSMPNRVLALVESG